MQFLCKYYCSWYVSNTTDDPLLLYAHHAVARQPLSAAEHYGIPLGNVLRMSTLRHLRGSVCKEWCLFKTHKFPLSTHGKYCQHFSGCFSYLSCCGSHDECVAFAVGENSVFAGLTDWCTHVIVTDGWISQMFRPVTHAVDHQRSFKTIKEVSLWKVTPSFTQLS